MKKAFRAIKKAGHGVMKIDGVGKFVVFHVKDQKSLMKGKGGKAEKMKKMGSGVQAAHYGPMYGGW